MTSLPTPPRRGSAEELPARPTVSFARWLVGDHLPAPPPSLEGLSESELLQHCRSFGARPLAEVTESHWDALSRLTGLPAADRWELALAAPGWAAARLVAGLAGFAPGGDEGELLQRLAGNVAGRVWKALPRPELVRGLLACRSSWQAPPMPAGYGNGSDRISPDRRWMVRGRGHGEEHLPAVRLFPLDGRPAQALPWESDRPHLSFLEDGRLLVSGQGPAWELWRLEPLQRERQGPVPGGRTEMIAASPDGNRVALKGDGHLAVFQGRELLWSWPCRRPVLRLDWSPDGRYLSVTRTDGVSLVGPNGDVRPVPLPPAEFGGTTLAWSPDSRWLAVGNEYYRANEIRLWDVSAHEPAGQLDGLERGAAKILFSADGRHLVALDGSNEGWHVFDLATGRALCRPTTSFIGDLFLTPDDTVAVCMGDNRVNFFSLAGRGLGTVPGGRDGARWVGFDGNGMGFYSGDGSYRDYVRAGLKPLALWTAEDVRAAEAERAQLQDPATIMVMFGVGSVSDPGPEVHVGWSFLLEMVKCGQGRPKATLSALDVGLA